MTIQLHKNFEKQYKKLKTSERQKVKDRLQLFIENPFNPSLNNHQLKGKYTDYRSISVSGDLRAIFKMFSETEYIFVAVGSHSNLYS